MKALEVQWFSGTDNIGIVKAEDEATGEIFFYISKVKGIDEAEDIKHIVDWGSKMGQDRMLSFFEKNSGDGR